MTKNEEHAVPSGADIEALLRERTNWGRWGEDDQIGTLNLITQNKRRAAAGLVRSGRSVTLSRPLPTEPAANNPRPAEYHMGFHPRPGAIQAGTTTDYLGMQFHGSSSTHMDALSHVWTENGGYNGWSLQESLSFGGSKRGGIEHYRDGVMTRGVLLDVPGYRGVPYVTQDEPVHDWELRDIARAQGVSIEPGDALIVNCGRDAFERENLPYGSNIRQPGAQKPGLHASCLWFLRDMDISVLVWDMLEVIPFGYDLPYTVHGAIAAFGLTLVDNADLAALTELSKTEGRYDFMFTVAPLVIVGATGSPVNPIATF
jgi:kynurenine formamidase